MIEGERPVLQRVIHDEPPIHRVQAHARRQRAIEAEPEHEKVLIGVGETEPEMERRIARRAARGDEDERAVVVDYTRRRGPRDGLERQTGSAAQFAREGLRVAHQSDPRLDEVLDARAEGPNGALETPKVLFRISSLASDVEPPAL